MVFQLCLQEGLTTEGAVCTDKGTLGEMCQLIGQFPLPGATCHGTTNLQTIDLKSDSVVGESVARVDRGAIIRTNVVTGGEDRQDTPFTEPVTTWCLHKQSMLSEDSFTTAGHLAPWLQAAWNHCFNTW